MEKLKCKHCESENIEALGGMTCICNDCSEVSVFTISDLENTEALINYDINGEPAIVRPIDVEADELIEKINYAYPCEEGSAYTSNHISELLKDIVEFVRRNKQ